MNELKYLNSCSLEPLHQWHCFHNSIVVSMYCIDKELLMYSYVFMELCLNTLFLISYQFILDYGVCLWIFLLYFQCINNVHISTHLFIFDIYLILFISSHYHSHSLYNTFWSWFCTPKILSDSPHLHAHPIPLPVFYFFLKKEKTKSQQTKQNN